MRTNYRHCRVTVMGLGHFGGGAAAARWLAQQGAIVTITDLADRESLADALRTLAGVPIAACHFGGHSDEDFRHADLVVVNPAVRPGNPLLGIARGAGARLTTEIELFLEACPAPVIGVTGSNGKSTTAAMTAAICEAQGFSTWLGGNLGGSLLPALERIGPNDWVVLELSSFQLWRLDPRTPSPHVAVVTGCSPNHLDWHATFADYAAAKQRLLTGQQPNDLAVLNTFDPGVAAWGRFVRARMLPLVSMDELPPLRVHGRVNRINAACAATAARGVGCRPEAVCRGLQSFVGLPQRLERMPDRGGRRFYNDSAATTPESVIAALDSLDEPVWILVGGRDKGFDFGPLVAAIARGAQGAAFFGSVAPALHDLLTAAQPEMPCTTVNTMDEALDWCWTRSKPGEAIVLSPACSSHDQYRNFRQRGERFVELVESLDLRGKARQGQPE
jgi:UDP-N-acetylmuramoylalanine--D-glutamate ligase